MNLTHSFFNTMACYTLFTHNKKSLKKNVNNRFFQLPKYLHLWVLLGQYLLRIQDFGAYLDIRDPVKNTHVKHLIYLCCHFVLFRDYF